MSLRLWIASISLLALSGCSMVASFSAMDSLKPSDSPDSSESPFQFLRVNIGTKLWLSSEILSTSIRQPDGKVLVTGYYYLPDGSGNLPVMMRLLADGSSDASFGENGTVIPEISTITADDYRISAIALQPDGKILIGGSVLLTGGSSSDDILVIRFHPNGALDSSFATGGILTLDLGGNDYDRVGAIALQSDGKIVLGGGTSALGSPDFMLARLNADGSLDPTFGTGGIFIEPQAQDDVINALAIQSDGKIVAGGESYDDPFVARFLTNGSFDTSFNGTGRSDVDVPGQYNWNTLSKIKIQSDGKIVSVGTSVDATTGNDFFVSRHNTDGTLDTSFGGSGIVNTDFAMEGDEAYDLDLQSDGKILVGGSARASSTSEYLLGIIRYNTDGTLDSSFGINGKSLQDLTGTGGSNSCFGLWLIPGGKIQATCMITRFFDSYFAVTQMNADGSVDTSFATAGLTTKNAVTKTVPTNDGLADLIVLPDGKLLSVGMTDQDNLEKIFLTRHLADGTLDPSFGTAGMVLHDFNPDGSEFSGKAARQTDGKILITVSTGSEALVARLLSNGSIDPSFGGGDGIVVMPFDSSRNAMLRTLFVAPDGKILAAGFTEDSGSHDMAVVRLLEDGSLDSSFGVGGEVLIDFPATGGEDFASFITVLADGKILVVGRSVDFSTWDGAVALARLETNGSLDSSFGTGGRVTKSIDTRDDEATALAIQPDGKILVAVDNSYNSVSGSADFALMRFNPDGSADSSFGTAGTVVTDMSSGAEDYLSSMFLQSDGRILVAGSSMGLSNGFKIIRYNADGTVDPSLAHEDIGGFGEEVWISHIFADGDGLLLGGGIGDDIMLMRMNADGSRN